MFSADPWTWKDVLRTAVGACILALSLYLKADAWLKITDYKWCKSTLHSAIRCLTFVLDFGNFFFTLIDSPASANSSASVNNRDNQESSTSEEDENPHPTHLIGQLGYYAIALLTQSYILFVLALTANISNLTFLWLVETPHMQRRSSHESNRPSQTGKFTTPHPSKCYPKL